jgi:hypothetical protein
VCTENSILAPRIHGELLKLGFEVAQSSVAKYMVKRSNAALGKKGRRLAIARSPGFSGGSATSLSATGA